MSTFGEATIHEFIGWLSADVPELHGVDVPRLADSWERFKARKKAVIPWKTAKDRAELAMAAKAGDRWVQIKSGRVATVLGPVRNGSLPLKHENGNHTSKWRSYFAQEFTPESPPTSEASQK